MCIYVCFREFMSHACRCPWKPEEGIMTLELKLQMFVNHLVFVLGPELGHLEEQQNSALTSYLFLNRDLFLLQCLFSFIPLIILNFKNHFISSLVSLNFKNNFLIIKIFSKIYRLCLTNKTCLLCLLLPLLCLFLSYYYA